MPTIPDDWLPAAPMQRIIVHWTAGNYKANKTDKRHYHLLIEGDGTVVRGPSIARNQRPLKKGYAAHTRRCNSGSIGVALCCMSSAVESPFNAGRAPTTRAQWESLVKVVATLARRYRIPVTPQSVLSHAEVQDTLGIEQPGKWDFTRLAFDSSVVGAKACGDKLRAEVSALPSDMSPGLPQVNGEQIAKEFGALIAKVLGGLIAKAPGVIRKVMRTYNPHMKR